MFMMHIAMGHAVPTTLRNSCASLHNDIIEDITIIIHINMIHQAPSHYKNIMYVYIGMINNDNNIIMKLCTVHISLWSVA